MIAAMVLSGCVSTPPAEEYCVPRVTISPVEVRPGDTITVTVESGCDVPMPAGGWVVIAGPVGQLDLAVRTVTEAELVNGFAVTVELPADFPGSEGFAGLDYWDYSGCPDNASCASPVASFRVAQSP
ncbi:MAG: hypothetical protein C0444_10405 [Microbacterium sp.]|nr:hypothetical protein [Microbacterium sp.]